MIKLSQLTKPHYKPKDISQFLGVTTKTLQNWDKEGKIAFRRDAVSNRRYLTKEETIQLLEKHGLFLDDSVDSKRDVIYARVSSHDQKKQGDLARQVQFLIQETPDLKNLLVLSEVGSGLNDERRELQKLIQMVMNDEVSRVFITYKDRLTRSGYNFLKTVFRAKDVEIIVVNQDIEEVSIK